MDTPSDLFGHRLRRLIEEKRISVEAFADSYGIARSTAHLWLNRAGPPLEKHWTPLANFFGVSEKEIIQGTGSGAVAEEHGSYLTGTAAIAEAMREHFEQLLAAAGDDAGRLGWIREQMLRHLTLPPHWPSGERPRVLVPVTLPSQTQALSSKTGKPIPAAEHPARRARPA